MSLLYTFDLNNLFLFLESVNVTYIDRTGDKIKVRGKIGDNLLYLAHRYGIEVEGKLHVFYN